MSEVVVSSHEQLYAQARLYAEAFNWRDVPIEGLFLKAIAQAHLGREVRRVLELASGPAEHARWFAAAQPPIEAHALDASAAMLAYASDKAQALGVALQVHREDMCDFELRGLDADLAFCLVDSISYITDHDAFASHLVSVAGALAAGGVYVIETVHPKEQLGSEPMPERAWSVERDGRTISVEFGLEGDAFDSLTQVRQTRVRITEREGERVCAVLEDLCPMKLYLYQEILALLRGSPFELVATRGELALDVPFDDSEASWRMVLILQKRAEVASS